MRKKERIQINNLVGIKLNSKNTMPPGASQYVLKYIDQHDEYKTVLFDIDDLKLNSLLFYLKQKGISLSDT
jgi:hypothetical protein